jgi:hypothetical protein
MKRSVQYIVGKTAQFVWHALMRGAHHDADLYVDGYVSGDVVVDLCAKLFEDKPALDKYALSAVPHDILNLRTVAGACAELDLRGMIHVKAPPPGSKQAYQLRPVPYEDHGLYTTQRPHTCAEKEDVT